MSTYVSASLVSPILHYLRQTTVLMYVSVFPCLLIPNPTAYNSHDATLPSCHLRLQLLTLHQDFLGQAFCTLGEIVGSPASRLEKPLG